MKKVYFLMICLMSCAVFASCSDDDNDDYTDTNGDQSSGGTVVSDNFETNSQDIDVKDAVLIHFNDDNTVDITNPFTSTVNILYSDQNVIVNAQANTTPINYVLSGKASNGSLKISSNDAFNLILNGVSIVNNNGAAIDIQSASVGYVSTIENTNNRLIDGEVYASTETAKGALYSAGSLTLSGSGKLQVTGRNKHAIASEALNFDGANVSISGSVKDGIHTNSYFLMNSGSLTVNSTSDGVECEKGYITLKGGDLTISSTEGDGLKTSYSKTDLDRNIYIEGGNLEINLTGDASKGIKSKGDVTIGASTICINSDGNAYYDTEDQDTSSSAGIKADGNAIVNDGASITINSTGKGGKGMNITGTLTFNGGTTTVTTTGDQYVYDKNNDTAAKAIKSEGDLTVNAGTIKIKTTKTEAEGLESKSTLRINGGDIEIEAYDDCINASNHIEITGGTIYCVSETNDAIDSNGTLTISGGLVIAVGSAVPEDGFDCDNNTFKITGGTLIGIGGSTSTPTSSVCTQASLIYGGGSFDLIHIESADGSNVLTFKLPKTLNQTTLLFSSADFKQNQSYTLYTGGSVSGGTSTYGLYEGAVYTKGTQVSTFTTSSVVTNLGTSSNNPGGGMGGMGGGGNRPF